jgi:hypothetical protein
MNQTIYDFVPETWQPPHRPYAVLDACDDPLALEYIHSPEIISECLFKGSAERDFAAIAPYLITIDEPTFLWLTGSHRQVPWGIFVQSQAGMKTLRQHFRKFLLAVDDTHTEYYFRFYDPRVLPVYLDSCTAKERNDFFGPIDKFGVLSDEKFLEFGR